MSIGHHCVRHHDAWLIDWAMHMDVMNDHAAATAATEQTNKQTTQQKDTKTKQTNKNNKFI